MPNPLTCAICGKEIREAERYVKLPDGRYAHRKCARTKEEPRQPKPEER